MIQHFKRKAKMCANNNKLKNILLLNEAIKSEK